MTTFGELLDTGRYHNGVVCVDCLMGIANGDWPTVANLGAYDVTVGHLHIGEWADASCWHYGAECGDDCSCEETEFSSRGCSVCGTYLAGYRHAAIMVNRDDLTNQPTETGN